MKKYISLANGGSLAGAIAFALFLVIYYGLGSNPFGMWKFLILVVPAVLMYRSVRNYRETEGEGFLTYGQGLMAGIVFGFVYASLNAMLIYLYGLTIDGGYVEAFKLDNLETLGQSKDQLIGFIGENQYREMINEIESMTLGGLAFGDFQSKSIGVFLMALIVAGILKQTPPTFDTEDE